MSAPQPCLIAQKPKPGIHVVRFSRPDLREELYDEKANIRECTLYDELQDAVLSNLGKGEKVVLNFGLVDRFPTAFYRVLLAILEDVQSHGGRLLLCCLTPNVREGFDLFGGSKLFEVFVSESRALAEAEK